MNPVREALYGVLSASGALTALLSSPAAIYHQRAPQDAQAPYVIFHKTDGRPQRTFGDHTQWDLWLVKGITRGGSASKAEQIAAQIDLLLDNAPLTVDGHEHLYLAREADVDYPEDDGAETYHHCGATYRIVTEPV